MKKWLSIFGLVLLCVFQSYAQTVTASQEALKGYENIPQEKIFVHYNANLLFTGEYLYYKVYCKNNETDVLSTLSKVAYVSLVGSDKKPIFTHKVRLNNGVGQGDFFLPVGTPSGSYKLIAYTQWMRNGGDHHFFKDNIGVINPYQNAQESILASNDNENSRVEVFNGQNNGTDILNTSGVTLETNNTLFGKREKVLVTLNSLGTDLWGGSYSLSVRKKDFEIPFSKKTSKNYKEIYKSTGSPTLGSRLFLPELRGEVVWGKVTSKSNGSPISNTKVALSIPGQDFVSKIANTNAAGVFYFILQEEFNDTNATFQVLGDTEVNYNIEVSPQTPMDYTSIEFEKFSISPDLEEAILQRSVYNQIENGYYELKPDTIKVPLPSPPFYGKRGRAYNLDDYKRFNTVKETFLEFIDDAWTKNVAGETVFSVRAYENTLSSNFPPLIIVDGIILQDQQKLLNYPARRIKTISIVRDKYYLGADVFQGVIIVETMAGDFYESLTENYVSKIDLFSAQPQKTYFAQNYATAGKTNRIPDFRSQLLWKPNLEVSTLDQAWEFYTSDNIGVYEISLEGFTKSGKPVSLQKTIRVE